MHKIIIFLILPVVFGVTKFCTDKKCNRSNSRIGSGQISERNSRPFQVALYSRVGTTGPLGFCGGSLVHQEWVITAAHCCFHDEVQVDNIQAILGAYSLYDRYENGRRIVNVDTVLVHPGYEPETFANDLALLKLANIVQLTETIDVIRFPYLSQVVANFAGQGAIASGWGIAAEGVTFVSPTLREYVMVVATDNQCNSLYQSLLPPNVMCGLNTTAGTCKGDNGGPMTIFLNATEENILISNRLYRLPGRMIDKNMWAGESHALRLCFLLNRRIPDQSEPVAVGVTSFIDASGCNTNRASVFTRVQRYLDWISEVTGIVLD